MLGFVELCLTPSHSQHNKSDILPAERRGRRGSLVGCGPQCLGGGLLRRDSRFFVGNTQQHCRFRVHHGSSILGFRVACGTQEVVHRGNWEAEPETLKL